MELLRDPSRPRDWLDEPGAFGKGGSFGFVDVAAMDGWRSDLRARYEAQRRAAALQHFFMTEANTRLRQWRDEFPRGWKDVAARGAHSATTLSAASNGSRTANLRQMADIEQVLGDILVVAVASPIVQVGMDVRRPRVLIVRGTPESGAEYMQGSRWFGYRPG